MRSLRAGLIGSINAWLPSRRSVESHRGAWVIVVLGQIRWSELPGRAAQWVAAHWRKLRLFAWAALFVAVLVYF